MIFFIIITVAILLFHIHAVKGKRVKTVEIRETKARKRGKAFFIVIIIFSFFFGFVPIFFPQKKVQANSFSESKTIYEKKIFKSEKWYEYNSVGLLVSLKYGSGLEEQYKYDGKGNQIYVKTSLRVGEKIVSDETYFRYDKNNNIIYMKQGDSETWWKYKYNSNEKKIWKREEYYQNGILESWKNESYDERGNVIYSKNSSGWEEWYIYDGNNNPIYFKQAHLGAVICEVTTKYEYDANGNKTHEVISNGNEAWFECDRRNNLIHELYSDGRENIYEYDIQNNIIHEKKSNGFERWVEYEYDEKNRKKYCAEYTNGRDEF